MGTRDELLKAVVSRYRSASRIEKGRMLAERTFDAICANDYGQYDDLIALLAPALGPKGLDHLKARVVDLARTPVATPPDREREKIGWATSGPIYADQIARSRHDSTVRQALEAIAEPRPAMPASAFSAEQTILRGFLTASAGFGWGPSRPDRYVWRGALVSDFYAGLTSRFDRGNEMAVDLLTARWKASPT